MKILIEKSGSEGNGDSQRCLQFAVDTARRTRIKFNIKDDVYFNREQVNKSLKNRKNDCILLLIEVS